MRCVLGNDVRCMCIHIWVHGQGSSTGAGASASLAGANPAGSRTAGQVAAAVGHELEETNLQLRDKSTAC